MMIEALSTRVGQLLTLLSDGEFHSRGVLAKKIGLSLTDFSKTVSKVASFGVEVRYIRARGYCLARAWQPLDAVIVGNDLGEFRDRFDIEMSAIVTSSNTVLLNQISSGVVSGKVLAVELQTDGRGRMGRHWHSSLGDALTFSLVWRFNFGLNELSGLSLAIGVAIIRALNKLGASAVQLKWPNDIVAPHGKLAGVLIEAKGDASGSSVVVIGIGINYRLPNERLVRKIEQPVSALSDVCLTLPTRNKLLATLLQEFAVVLDEFSHCGFSELQTEWEQYHVHQHKLIQLFLPNGEMTCGLVRGVNQRGELCLENGQAVRYFNSGEVGGQISEVIN